MDEANVRRTSPVLKGVLLGGVAGGLALAAGYRLSYGPCDDTESYIPCEALYVMLFGVGFVPGGLVGGLTGATRK